MNAAEFLKDAAAFPDLILITKKEGIVSEVRGKFSVDAGEEWLTLKNEACRCHIHLKTEGLGRPRFIRSKNKEGRDMFSIEIPGQDGELLLKASFPTKSDLEGSRAAFESLESKYGQASPV